jgi:hypothetical protein
MSAVSVSSRAIKDVDEGVGAWLADLVTGAGSSPSHIIVTGILGVVPGVGQVMDARDLVLGVIAVAKTPGAVGAWVDLVITLIGCIPAAGDALKVGFKLMQKGVPFGRVLEAVSPKMRGNVEQFMHKIDWTGLAAQCKTLFGKSIDAFVDGLDCWVVKAVAGRAEVAQITQELRALERRGPAMIDEAIGELRQMHQKMLGHELPKNTAAVAPTRPVVSTSSAARTAEQELEATRRERKLSQKRAAQEKVEQLSSNSTHTSTKKKAKQKEKPWISGIPAEHITDYYVRRKHTHYRKANHDGRLIEEHSKGHNGLDHLWRNMTTGRPFVVGETKSSIFDSFKLMAALPADLQQAFNALRADEAANPTKNGQPNIFENADRDRYMNRRVPVGSEESVDTELRKGLAPPNEKTKLATQMSHLWIRRCVEEDKHLTSEGKRLIRLIRDWGDGDIDCPYNRWISLVTGRQLTTHRKSGGKTHQVQAVLTLPDNILNR